MMEKFSTRRVVKMINAGVLTPKARAKASSDGSYLPLAQFPEFSDAIDRQLARRAATGKNEDMQSLYKQVDKAERSRVQWRWVRNKFRGLVGVAGLLIWLAAIGALGLVLFIFGGQVVNVAGNMVRDLLSDDVIDKSDGLDINAPESERAGRNIPQDED